MFSSAVPSQLVFSISHARQDGIARVAARMLANASLIGGRVRDVEGPRPAAVVRGEDASGLGVLVAGSSGGWLRAHQPGAPFERRTPR